MILPGFAVPDPVTRPSVLGSTPMFTVSGVPGPVPLEAMSCSVSACAENDLVGVKVGDWAAGFESVCVVPTVVVHAHEVGVFEPPPVNCTSW